jgi:3-hydroxy-9,10-secoandrosta-1,3,5(10)-triene-9,17-dione monooxygenase
MSDSIPDRHALIARARALIPRLRERAAECETLRRLPDATQRDFLEADLYRLYLPRRYGGFESDYQLQVDIAAEIGRGCGSSAWVLSILASHSWVQGMMPPEAQDEVWARDPDALIASAFPARGATARAIAGGMVLDGQWSFASGVDVCTWAHFNVLLPQERGPPVHYFVAVPRADYTVIDDWYTVGMRGTGSKSIAVANLFVPAHRGLNTHDCVGGATPGSAVNPGTLYRMPLFALFGHGIAGPAVGIARGAFDAICEPMAARRSQAGVAVAEQPTVQLRLAEASAEIDAARALLKEASDDAAAYAARDAIPPLAARVRYRRNGAYAGTLCQRAVERLYPLAGANGLAEASPFQRSLRDIHACCAHIALTWDVQAANYGGVLLGRPSSDPKL